MNSLKIVINLVTLAFKNLWRRKARTVLTVVAVTIGTTAVISLVAITTGAQEVFMAQMEKTGVLTQITVIASNEVESVDIFGGGIGDVEGEKITDETVNEVRSVEHIIAVSPQVQVWSFRTIAFKDSDKRYRVEVTAVTPNQAIEMNTSFGQRLKLTDYTKIFLAHKTAEALIKDTNYELNDLIGKTVTFNLEKGHFTQNMDFPEDIVQDYFTQQEILHRQGRHEEAGKIPYPLDDIVNTVEAEIVGIGLPGPDEWRSYISLAWGKELMTRKNIGGPKMDEYGNPTGEYETHIWDEFEEKGYHTLVAKVNDVDNVEQAAEEIRTKYNRGAITAKDFLESFLRIFLVVQIALGGIGGIALLVASIGIINTMLMAILERTSEIGLLKAVGATGGMVGWIFTFEAGLIGLLGGGLGIGAGMGISEIVNYIASTQLTAQNFVVENIIGFPTWLIGGALVFSFVLGVISGLYPALRAAKLNPIDALRAE